MGAAAPDLPAVFGAAYHVGPGFLGRGRCPTDSEEVLQKIYFTGPFGATGSGLHSAFSPLALLAFYGLSGLKERDGEKVLLLFLLGWLGHAFVDFLTHADDVRPLLWPLSGRTWSSPISYYDPRHHGREFSIASNGLALTIASVLLAERLRERG